jgi:hypothetical protein
MAARETMLVAGYRALSPCLSDESESAARYHAA